MTALAMDRDDLTPADHLRMIGRAQMIRFKHPDWTPERIAHVMGAKPALVRAWAFRDTYKTDLRGLSQYRYPKPGEELLEDGEG